MHVFHGIWHRCARYAKNQSGHTGQATTQYLKVTVLRSNLQSSIAQSQLEMMQTHPGLRHTLQ